MQILLLKYTIELSRRRGTRNDAQATMNLTPLSVWFCCNHVPPDRGVSLWS
nr:MAG TPA_asm: hypothetical protein [Caudoviricetes sp.]